MKKLALISISLLLILAVSAATYFLLSDDTTQQNDAPDNTSIVNQIDYSPSTEEDAEYVESIKEELSEESQDESQGGEQSINYAIVSASIDDSMLTVGSTMSGSSSGICIVSVGDGSISESSETNIIDANGTSGCVSKINIASLNPDLDWEINARATLDSGDELMDTTTLKRDQR